MNKVALKICGITDIKSVITAHKNKIKSLGFASNNLDGPNTANDKKIKNLIKECNYYKIESVLLTRYFSLDELIKQIDYTKPKIISCSYHYSATDLKKIKKIFKKLKIGIAINPEKFDKNYIYSVKDIVDIFYYDLNVYKKNTITTYPIRKCTKQISFIKKVAKSIFIGGGVSEKNAHEIINIAKPDGLDISRSLKGKTTSLSNLKLKKFLSEVAAI
jgi:phosphoribosylanthranilate isomerase